uniref:Glycerate dehydrogenase n=1 Tax=Chromera velia CCMP2878 TaxID=1169474 RepID=A0A0G4I324_9ALVE|eukprot:Cvel_1733.t1-p1 / transcript=Cvel_1733.t1 / gene=Cvel_1733 / organism=Chromera_velia_CCMP2878 / gene_product=Putative 2-hydroxyacid dehydrogenase HI_1556, putative / transcript_product=Putative 2-hydroxyacid dehydrogenase HI_1556, putative / location=Cvel_scaffold63:35138-39832(+) / protein_length=380 / sequence_SO=supercontig / SO=protein_coding / is_pseudo=false
MNVKASPLSLCLLMMTAMFRSPCGFLLRPLREAAGRASRLQQGGAAQRSMLWFSAASGQNLKIAILDSYTTDRGELSWDPLKKFGSVTAYDRTPRDKIAERAGDADVILTNKVAFDEESLKLVPKCKYIGKLATGYNDVDLAAAKEKGIAVTNVPGYSTAAVVQLVIAFMLDHLIDVHGHNQSVRKGEWAECPDFCYDILGSRGGIMELSGKTLCIVGTGNIGTRIKNVAEAFGMNVLCAQVPGRPASADRVPLDEALSKADFISLNCPLTAKTTGLANDEFFGKCKKTAVFINTGRGPLVDEASLVRALDSGKIAAAYLDVLSTEPPANGASLAAIEHPKVTVTPHVGWASAEARVRLIDEVASNIEAWTKGVQRNRVA